MATIYEMTPRPDEEGLDFLEVVDAPVDADGKNFLTMFVKSGVDVSVRGGEPRLKDRWLPPTARLHQEIRRNDYPCLEATIPTFSPRAFRLLEDLLVPFGEVLPLHCDAGNFICYNPTHLANVLDVGQTEASWYPHAKGKGARSISYYSLTGDLDSLVIFRIPQAISSIFVSEAFVQRVRGAFLEGFTFSQIWPATRSKPGSFREMETRGGVKK